MTLDLRGIHYVLKADTQGGVVGINAATEALKKADAAATRTSGAFLQFGKNGELTARQLQALSYQTTDIVTALASGQSPFLVLLQQGGQLRDQFGGVGNVVRAFAASITVGKVATLGLLSAVGALGFAWLKGHQETEQFNKTLALTGNAAGLTQGRFDSMARSIAAATGNTIGNAREALQGLAADGQFTGGAFEAAGRAALAMQRLTGDSADEIIKRFAGMRDNVAQWAVAANRSYNFLTVAQYEQIRTLEAQGRAQEAAKITLDALSQTMEARTAPALGLLERAWQSTKNAAADAWDAMLGIGRAETIEQQLDKVREQIARRTGPNPAFGPAALPMLRDQEAYLQEQQRLQRRSAEQAAKAAEETQQGIRNASKAAIDSRLREESAGYALSLALQTRALDRAQAEAERGYTALALSAADYRDTLERIALQRARIEEQAGQRAVQDARRRLAAVEKPEEAASARAAIVDAEAKLVGIRSKREQVEAKIADHTLVQMRAREVAFDPAVEFRNLERAQQGLVDQAFARGNSAARGLAADFARTNAELAAQTIADDRARGQALIDIEVESQRRRLQVGLTTAQEFKALEDGLAEYRIARNRQLTEQLKPEWQRQLDLYADVNRHMAQSFNEAMNTATRASEDAWVDMVTKGEFSARRLVQAINEQLARIGWQKYLAAPAASIFEQFFGGLFGGFGGGLGGGNLSEVGGTGAFVYHAGGVAGSGPMRRVPASVFAGAPRYHLGGLAGDEVPAILQRGERVLPRGASAGNVTINANFYPADGQSPAAYAAAVGPQLRQLKAELIGEMARPGTPAHAAARR